MKIAIYPGSFDPITNGHLDVLKRSLKVFDEVILLLAVNPTKKSNFSVSDRLKMMKGAVEGIDGVAVDYTAGLTVEYAKNHHAVALIRGLRAVSDFEYEFQLAAANHFASPDIEMIFFMAKQDTSFISSSTINQLFKNGVDIAPLVPKNVYAEYQKLKK